VSRSIQLDLPRTMLLLLQRSTERREPNVVPLVVSLKIRFWSSLDISGASYIVQLLSGEKSDTG
jgi:hypothetical protein